MPVLLRIALRNLREHKAKTLIVGIIISLGILVMVIGNSLMDTVTAGLREAFIEGYTGDVMIRAKSASGMSLFGYTVSTGTEEMPTIPDYGKVYSLVKELPEVVNTTSQLLAYAMLDAGQDKKSFAILYGIEPESYFSMFPKSIEILEGERLKPGEEGIMLSEASVKNYRERFKIDLRLGDPLVATGVTAAGFRIRELPLKGIFKNPVSQETLNMIAFVDAQSVRALSGMVLSTPRLTTTEKPALLSEQNMENLFGADMVEQSGRADTDVSEKALLSILGPAEKRPKLQLDSGAWNFLLIRLRDSKAAPKFISTLNAELSSRNIEATAVDWITASGPAAGFVIGIKWAFNIVVILVAVVAVIIIMNTLVISVIERTSEIGTMRALGAQKRFVRRMFVLETLSISIIFGAAGAALGSALLLILGAVGFTVPKALEFMLGPGVFKPTLSAGTLSTAALVVLLIGLVSSLYPVIVALRIPPVKAIQTE